MAEEELCSLLVDCLTRTSIINLLVGSSVCDEMRISEIATSILVVKFSPILVDQNIELVTILSVKL